MTMPLTRTAADDAATAAYGTLATVMIEAARADTKTSAEAAA